MEQATVQPLPHGGDLGAGARLFPQAPLPWIDLSTGINPWPYPVPDLPIAAWTRLPSPADMRDLVTAAATCYGVPDPACIAAAPGSQILIHTLPFLFAPAEVAVLCPTYGEHAPAWARAGHHVRQVTDLPAPDGPLPDMLVLVNPNNPDGRLLPPDRLLALADRLAERGGWLVVDEAFADLVPDHSLAPQVGREGLILLRSFGKFFGLAGVRLGFLLAPPALARAMADRIGPWPVAGAAIHIGCQALADGEWQTATRNRLTTARQELDALLMRARLPLLGGTDLFRLVDAGSDHLFHRLASAGLWSRIFAGRLGWIRLGLPPDRLSFGRLKRVLINDD